MQFAAGHACYHPRDALSAKQAYEIQYANPCEPYIVILNAALPAFDERFHGRVRDKVAILTQAAAVGTRFVVNPEAFLLHLPHEPVTTLLSMAARRVKLYGMTVPFVLTADMLERVAGGREYYAAVKQQVPGLGRLSIGGSGGGSAAAKAGSLAVMWSQLREALVPDECELDARRTAPWLGALLAACMLAAACVWLQHRRARPRPLRR